MSEIKKLTESIRNNAEDLDYGTLKTLKTIDDESVKLEKQISNFIDYTNSQDKKIKDLEIKNKNLQDAITKYIEGKK